jgi:hypothetical protein
MQVGFAETRLSKLKISTVLLWMLGLFGYPSFSMVLECSFLILGDLLYGYFYAVFAEWFSVCLFRFQLPRHRLMLLEDHRL